MDLPQQSKRSKHEKAARPGILTIAALLVGLGSLVHALTPFLPGVPWNIKVMETTIALLGVGTTYGVWNRKRWGMVLAIAFSVINSVSSALGIVQTASLSSAIGGSVMIAAAALVILLTLLPSARQAYVDDPYGILARLDYQLALAMDPEEVLPLLVSTIASTLKLSYVAVRIAPVGFSTSHDTELLATHGQANGHTEHLPLVYQGETVGQLVLAPRPGEASLTPPDRRVLEGLARHAGVIAHAVRLTADLRRSRERLVLAREEERRRLRRDLHDGLGSVLAALNWRAGALRPLLHRDPVTAEALLVEQQHTIQAAIADIRRLVYDLRPPALDELGLIGALREQAAKLRTDPARDRAAELLVEVDAPEILPMLPAAVEVAAYRIVQEALTNVARHAQAHHASLRLSCTKERLEIDLLDDGVGLPAAHPVGVGLLSMRERAAEVGGSCEVQRVPEGGTRVHAVLPLPRDED